VLCQQEARKKLAIPVGHGNPEVMPPRISTAKRASVYRTDPLPAVGYSANYREKFWEIRGAVLEFAGFFQPTTQPTKSMSYMNSRVLWHSPRSFDTVEVWGSSPHGPTIFFNGLASTTSAHKNPNGSIIRIVSSHNPVWIPSGLLSFGSLCEMARAERTIAAAVGAAS
jgi:hypothetical protein